jgi:tetratricopeptide (TPR) repeat protein
MGRGESMNKNRFRPSEPFVIALFALAALMPLPAAAQDSGSGQGVLSTTEGNDATTAAVSRCLELLGQGRQADAEQAIGEAFAANPRSQELAFYAAALARSRFISPDAGKLFDYTASLDASTLFSRVSRLIVDLDDRRDVERNFTELESIVEQNPEDMMFRWLLAIQCRMFAYDKESPAQEAYYKKGVEHFKTILEHWNPGPVLAHHTFANLLDDLYMNGEALPHRCIAVRQEPKGWSYLGLWWTLSDLNLYPEAKTVIERAIACDPTHQQYAANLRDSIIVLNIESPSR